jgi:hypothetical protein
MACVEESFNGEITGVGILSAPRMLQPSEIALLRQSKQEIAS